MRPSAVSTLVRPPSPLRLLFLLPLLFNFTFLLAPCSASGPPPASAPPEYHEHLHLRPLPHSALLASFQFRSSTSLSAFESQNYRFFPRSLGQILQRAGARELHLRFGLGRWDAEAWGARPWDGRREGGTGVELWAWLDADTDREADAKWLVLTNALSGLFCASLNFIDRTRTTRPVMSFQPEGDHRHPAPAGARLRLLHGVLPREVVCTENLTPFLKLLPCKGKAGISSLLDGHKLFDASWQSMAVVVRPVCGRAGGGGGGGDDDGGEDCRLEIEQTIDMVLDIERSKRPRDNPIPRPPPGEQLPCDTTKPYHSTNNVCFPVDHLPAEEWTLSQVFGKPIKGTCLAQDAAADYAPVCISVPPGRPVYTSGGAVEVKRGGDTANAGETCYRLDRHQEFEIFLPAPPAKEERDGGGGGDAPQPWGDVVRPEAPLLYAERSFMGYGQQHGAVQAILTNPSPDTAVEFVYMESLPWFMRVYLHTLEARVADSLSSPPPSSLPSSSSADIIREMHYRPAVDRERGTQLELRVRVPAGSTVFLKYDFEKSILRYTEYPPDANRGFDVASAVIITLAPRAGSSLRTTALLLSLPTPDFSMPYNVIIFTSTAIALAFGGLYNIIVRRFVGADEGPAGPLARLGLRAKVADLVGRFKERRRRHAAKTGRPTDGQAGGGGREAVEVRGGEAATDGRSQ